MAQEAIVAEARYAIVADGLTKTYGAQPALKGLSLRVRGGSIFGFLGPNGAGKTTAVKLLLGLARPTEGSGEVLGAPLGSPATRRRVGYLPELFRYQEWLSAREVLALHAALMRLERALWAREIERVLALVGLAGRADSRVATFSKGMQQRLGLAVALLGRPELVFLDEPTSALDPVGRHDVRAIVRTLRREGTTVFLNSHLLAEIEQTCDEVAIVKSGRVIAAGALDAILGEDTLRIRATGVDESAFGAFAGVTVAALAGDWFEVRGIAESDVPELLHMLIARDARVYAVEPGKQTLEQRFLDLLKETS